MAASPSDTISTAKPPFVFLRFCVFCVEYITETEEKMEISLTTLKDQKLLVGRGKKTLHSHPHPEKPSWYAPDFFLNDPTPWITHESYEIVDTLQYEKAQAKRGQVACFKAMFDDIQIKKAVAYTFQDVENFCWKSALSHITERGKSHYIYGTDGILGATPELLFDLEKEGLSTVALAATAENPDDLFREKELEEHQIVVDAILEELAPFGPVVLGKKQAYPFKNLFHLKQDITLKASIDFETAVKVLHPTPALGAFPKKPGADWLKKWGNIVPRGRFGAPFGYVFPEREEARAFVAIRCVQWDDTKANLWAGAGITEKSSFAEETEEVLKKLSNTANLMGL